MSKVDLVIKNGTIVTPNGRFDAGIAVDKGKTVLIGDETNLPAAEKTLDVHGMYILPGMIDGHVHFRDPGHPEKEDFGTGTAGAAMGGITTVVDMPGTAPPVMAASVLEGKAKEVKTRAYVDFGLYAGAGVGNLEDMEGLAQAGAAAFKTYMPAGAKQPYCSSDDVSLFRVLERVATTGVPCTVHSENNSILEYLTGRLVASGRKDHSAHPESRPNFVEAEAISKVIIFGKALGTKVHIAHMSTGEGVHLVQAAKAQGQAVTAETCPQYLLLSQEEMRKGGAAYAKVDPPLRSSVDSKQLWEGLRNGSVDIIGSDHAPHTEALKDPTDTWKAITGMPGVETMLPLMLTKVNEGAITLERLTSAMSESVAKYFGLYPRKGTVRIGSDADFTIVDMKREDTINIEKLQTKGRKFAMYNGWKVRGVPIGTIVRGQIVMWERKLVGKIGTGEFIHAHHAKPRQS